MRRAALIFALVFPTLVTWVYFVALEGSSPALQQGAYSIGKVLQFAFPLLWLIGVRFSRPKVSVRGIGIGLAIGVAVAGLMLAIYFGGLATSELFRGPIEAVRAKTAGLGVGSTGKFIALGVFYSLGHAFLEEYYWRWFVFGVLCRGLDRDEPPLLSLPQSIAVSSLGFAAHHVLLVARFFGWLNPLTYLLAMSVAVGGVIWAWLYERERSLVAVWLSHLLVDAAIFVVGYAMIFRRS